MIEQMMATLKSTWAHELAGPAIRALVLLLLGGGLFAWLSKLIKGWFKKRDSPVLGLLAGNGLFLGSLAFFVFLILSDFGFHPVHQFRKLIEIKLVGSIVRTVLWLVIGLPMLGWASRWVQTWGRLRYSAQHGMIAGKIVFYGGATLIVFSILSDFDFPLGHLFGAAGVAGIAIGFASQTSVSNIISGLFLMGEKPFVVGDILTVGSVTGEVLSIDMLSVKLRTFDNKMVRIPNETIVKSEVTNITRFPIRRIDLQVGVAYKEDMGRVRTILLELAAQHPFCLQEPQPMVIFTGFGSSSIDMLFAVWVIKTNWLTVKNDMMLLIKQRFDAEGIEIPFPHMSLYTGEATKPLPVQLVDPAPNDAP